MRCRVCNGQDLRFLWHTSYGIPWFRCAMCRSDTSTKNYDEVCRRYDEAYLESYRTACGTIEDLRHTYDGNASAFDKHGAPSKTFLDVGCNEGSAMVNMRERGWESWGFDVNPAAVAENVVIGHALKAEQFDRKFGAIMCRECIEHIPDWGSALSAITELLLPGGIVQIQTPTPTITVDDTPYCPEHLQLFDPYALRMQIELRGCKIVEHRLWDIKGITLGDKPDVGQIVGQLWIARKAQ